MLEILSGNRNLAEIIQEEASMLSQVKYSDLPSYGLGIQRGEAIMLQNLLQLKFGLIPEHILERLQTASSAELLTWSERMFNADSLAGVFAEH